MDVQITVASKVPVPDKKTSKVVDTTGKTWYVYNTQFNQLQEGNSYNITKYKTSDFKGSTYYYIETFTPIGSSGGGGGGTGAPLVNGGVRQAGPPRYPVDAGKIDNERRMDIFICGAFNNIMANPNVHPLELTLSQKAAQVNELRQIWLTTLGPNRPSPISTSQARMDPPAAPAHNADLDDQIPF